MAKYDSLRKIKRNEALREYAESHPDLSQNEVGEAFHISPSRVSRILHNNGRKIESR